VRYPIGARPDWVSSPDDDVEAVDEAGAPDGVTPSSMFDEVAWKHWTLPAESRSGSTRRVCEKALPVRVLLIIESVTASALRIAPMSFSTDSRVVCGPWISSSVRPITCGILYSHIAKPRKPTRFRRAPSRP